MLGCGMYHIAVEKILAGGRRPALYASYHLFGVVTLAEEKGITQPQTYSPVFST